MRELTLAPWLDTSSEAVAFADTLLAAPESSVQQRVRALLARRGMAGSAAVADLRVALRDEAEEVRLLAHALLERRELASRDAIDALEAELRAASGDARFVALCRLAHAHYARVCALGLRGVIADEALAHAHAHASDALAVREDGEVCMLLARIELSRHDGLAAWRWLQRAERAGISLEARAVSYAEASFILRRFTRVAEWLRRAGSRRAVRGELASAAEFWLRAPSNLTSHGPNLE